ncbi:putative gliotoxin efflux pump [Nemania sp. FL0916]|nr:putative gliotoxin efflux pump [Nemania sp. FL0916]
METNGTQSPPADQIHDKDVESLPSENSGLDNAAKVEYPPAWRQVIIVAGLLLGIFLAGLDINIIATAIPAITNAFNSLSEAGWYGSAFFLAYAALQSVWGKAYKYFDMKFVFLASMVVFEIGCLIGGIAPNSAALIVGRVIQGAGAAGILLGCYSIANFVSPPDKVPIIIGMVGTIFSVASVIGPLIGGVFTSTPHLTWRWCFYINLPIGGVPIFIIFFFFKTPPQAKIANNEPLKEIALSFDPLGVILFAGALVSYILALTWGGTEMAWNSSTIIGLFIGWILLTIVFVANEFWQGERALVVIRLLKKRDMWVNCLFLFFFYGSYFAVVYNIPTYFQATEGLSPRDSGIRTIPIIGATSVFSFVSSVLIGKYGKYMLFEIVGVVISAVAGGLIYTLDIDTDLGKQIGYQLLLGIGIGWVVQIPPIVAGVVNTNADKAIGLAAVLVVQFYSASLAISASSAITNNLLLQKLPIYAPETSPEQVLAIGPYDLASHFSGDTLLGIKRAYVEGLRGSWALSIALWGVAFLCALLAKWPGQMVPPPEYDVNANGEGEKQAPIMPTH